MPSPISKLAPDWWDYTTLDPELLADAARLDERKLKGLARPGFAIHVTIMQNARTSGGGNVALVPTDAATVGPREPGNPRRSRSGTRAITTTRSACA